MRKLRKGSSLDSAGEAPSWNRAQVVECTDGVRAYRCDTIWSFVVLLGNLDIMPYDDQCELQVLMNDPGTRIDVECRRDYRPYHKVLNNGQNRLHLGHPHLP
jgi:hypothetical protein